MLALVLRRLAELRRGGQMVTAHRGSQQRLKALTSAGFLANPRESFPSRVRIAMVRGITLGGPNTSRTSER